MVSPSITGAAALSRWGSSGDHYKADLRESAGSRTGIATFPSDANMTLRDARLSSRMAVVTEVVTESGADRHGRMVKAIGTK